MDFIKEEDIYDGLTGHLITKTTYQNEDVLKENERERLEQPETMQYMGKTLVRAARVHEGDYIRLWNEGYDILSSDPDEVRRALCHLQSNEPKLLTVRGKPFARHRNKWA